MIEYFDAYPFPFPSFTARPACAGINPVVFDDATTRQEGMAKRICRRCPVRDECLDYATANDERHGVWGGLTTRERDLMWTQEGAA